MRTRATTALALSVLAVLAGAGLVVGGEPVPPGDGAGPGPGDFANVSHQTEADRAAQYKVSFQNVTVQTWLVRNATVLNASVDEVVVRNATTADGETENVTLANVSVDRFVVDQGRLTNVTARTLVVRNRSVLNVPGGDLVDPDLRDRVIERHVTQRQIVSGVVIDRIVLEEAVLCENATLGQRVDGDDDSVATDEQDPPAITVESGTVDEVMIIRGAATEWSVGSIDRPDATNASLPGGCDRA